MYRNKDLSPKERAKALLTIMTIDEKVDQMSLGDLDKLTKALENGEEVPVHSGVFCQVDNVEKVNKINEWYIKNTRLGIPLLHYFESLHGFGNDHATHFPQWPGTPTEPGQDYVLSSPAPWMPFGYGLSYTTVEYSSLTAENTADGVKVTIDIENKGNYDIKESVLLFVSAKTCPITPFIKQLKAFSKVLIKKGEKKTVEFLLTNEAFSYIDENYKTAKNKGMHTITAENLAVNINVE